jgi:hypothetical protein
MTLAWLDKAHPHSRALGGEEDKGKKEISEGRRVRERKKGD